MRLLNILVICALILAASAVYKIKFDSTLQAERVAKLHSEIRQERNAIATLRAEWGKLDSPARIQALAERHLALKSEVATQFDTLDRLPNRPPPDAPNSDPIGAMLGAKAGTSAPETTGSVPASAPAQR
jgi:cell division protein FtsL